MKKAARLLAVMLVAVVCSASSRNAVVTGAQTNTPPGKPAILTPCIPDLPINPTKDGVLELAQKAINCVEPKLEGDDLEATRWLSLLLKSEKSIPSVLDQTVDSAVSVLTVDLASLRSLNGIIVSAAYLVQYAPSKIRVTNLFANALHMAGKKNATAGAMEYTLSLKPTSILAMLNLANAWLDINKDEKAKALLDKVLQVDWNRREAYIALATYYYKKKDYQRQLDAMVKAAKLTYWVKKKTRKNKEKTEEEEVKPDDPLTVKDEKTTQLTDLVPVTTADLIEDNYPDMAQQIRDKYQHLIDSERMELPLTPQVNTNGVRDYRRNYPVLKAWSEAIGSRLGLCLKELAKLQLGISPTDGKAAIRAKARAAAKEEVAKALGDAQKMLDYMKNIPGMDSKVEEANKKLQYATRKQGLPTPVPGDSPAYDPESVSILSNPPPGIDASSMLALTNYSDYMRIRNSYDAYFLHYFMDYLDKVKNIKDVYDQKIREENKLHDDNMSKLEEEYEAALAAASDSGKAAIERRHQLETEEEDLRHKKEINQIGDNYYRQWVNLYMPQYTQKMKPKLESYWRTCALYVRNMEDPEVMKREYVHVLSGYITWASAAADGIREGRDFRYLGETQQEEARLRKEIAEAEQEAREKKPEYENQTKSVLDALPRWLADKLEFKVSIQFLSLRITPHAIEFEAWLFGPSGKAIYNFQENSLTTYSSLSAKLDIGVSVGPMEVGLEARGTFLESHSTIYFDSGKVVEGTDSFAKADARLSMGPGDLASVGGSIQLDPALSNELSGKVTNTGLGSSKEYIF